MNSVATTGDVLLATAVICATVGAMSRSIIGSLAAVAWLAFAILIMVTS